MVVSVRWKVCLCHLGDFGENVSESPVTNKRIGFLNEKDYNGYVAVRRYLYHNFAQSRISLRSSGG